MINIHFCIFTKVDYIKKILCLNFKLKFYNLKKLFKQKLYLNMNHYQFNKKNFKPVYNDTCVDIQEKIEIITEKNNNILDRTTEKNKIIGSKKKYIA